MKKFYLLFVFLTGCMEVQASPLDSPDPFTPLAIESRRGAGRQGPGGADNLATTEAFLVEGANGLPVLFPWNSGVGVRCETAGWVQMSQAWPADYAVNARGVVTDTGDAPNDNDGFGAGRRIGSGREFFIINRDYFRQPDAIARRDGVCRTANAEGANENGYPCNDDADCRNADLDGGNNDICDTTTKNGMTAWERTMGAFLMGDGNCDWTTEK